jgi:hypothetical protein
MSFEKNCALFKISFEKFCALLKLFVFNSDLRLRAGEVAAGEADAPAGDGV